MPKEIVSPKFNEDQAPIRRADRTLNLENFAELQNFQKGIEEGYINSGYLKTKYPGKGFTATVLHKKGQGENGTPYPVVIYEWPDKLEIDLKNVKEGQFPEICRIMLEILRKKLTDLKILDPQNTQSVVDGEIMKINLKLKGDEKEKKGGKNEFVLGSQDDRRGENVGNKEEERRR